MSDNQIKNRDLDAEVREIRRKIILLKNGVVSDSMRDKGIVYKRNWGVDLPQIKEIAQMHEPSLELAERLWALEIRETIILATLLAPADALTEVKAEGWVADVENIEMAEQISMNLLSRLPGSTDIALHCAGSDEKWTQITGFTLAARIWSRFSAAQTDELIERAFHLSNTGEFFLYKSVAVVLGRLCRKDRETADKISNLLNTLSKDSVSAEYIRGEVENEISFLEF